MFFSAIFTYADVDCLPPNVLLWYCCFFLLPIQGSHVCYLLPYFLFGLLFFSCLRFTKLSPLIFRFLVPPLRVAPLNGYDTIVFYLCDWILLPSLQIILPELDALPILCTLNMVDFIDFICQRLLCVCARCFVSCPISVSYLHRGSPLVFRSKFLLSVYPLLPTRSKISNMMIALIMFAPSTFIGYFLW